MSRRTTYSSPSSAAASAISDSGQVVTGLFKLAGLERASAELIEDANPNTLESIGRSLVRKLGLALDLAFFEG
jgi:hypothetical protein